MKKQEDPAEPAAGVGEASSVVVAAPLGEQGHAFNRRLAACLVASMAEDLGLHDGESAMSGLLVKAALWDHGQDMSGCALGEIKSLFGIAVILGGARPAEACGAMDHKSRYAARLSGITALNMGPSGSEPADIALEVHGFLQMGIYRSLGYALAEVRALSALRELPLSFYEQTVGRLALARERFAEAAALGESCVSEVASDEAKGSPRL